jgi:hypothetical protein
MKLAARPSGLAVIGLLVGRVAACAADISLEPVSQMLSRATVPHDAHDDTKLTMGPPEGVLRVHRVIVFIVNPGRRRVQPGMAFIK